MPIILLAVIILLALMVAASCVRIVPQAHAMIIERLGMYKETWSTGLHFKLPFFDRIAKRVNLKEQVVDFAPQPVITKDNVTMRIDTVVYYQITDPKLYAYGVDNPIMAIENLTATTLRNIIGDLELDSTLTSRETINTKMRATLDEATDPWGIKVNRVELKNIIPPRDIQEAMANDTTDQLTGEAKSIWDKLERYYSGSEDGKSVWGWERIYGPAPSSYASIDEMQSDGRILINRFVGAPTETMTEKMSTLEKMRDEMFNKIIIGEASVDEFDKFVEDFNSLGGEQITNEVNEWYASVQ